MNTTERLCLETYREGLYHQRGWYGRPKDEVKAFNYFNQVIQEYHFIPAILEVARCYLDGNGVDQDEMKGVHYLRLAESKGSSLAANWLGSCYLDGEGVEIDFNTAAAYYARGMRMSKEDPFNFLPFYLVPMTSI